MNREKTKYFYVKRGRGGGGGGSRLIEAVRDKLLRACCHQLVNNLLHEDDITLVGATCCESVGTSSFITTGSRLTNHGEQAVRTLCRLGLRNM